MLRVLKKLLCAAICALMLSSCAGSKEADITGGTEPSVAIQTHGASVETEAVTTAETLNTEKLTQSETESASSSQSRHSQTTTTAPKATEPKPEKTSGESDYIITPSSGSMYATSSVNVREKPDADSKRVGALKENEEVTVTGLVSNGWVRIKFDDGEYFVNGSYLSRLEPVTETAPPSTTAATPATTTADSQASEVISDTTSASEPQDVFSGGEYEIANAQGTMVTTDVLNVRKEPDASSEKVGTLALGERVTVTGIVSNGWFRIIYNGGEYFVSGEYLRPAENTQQQSQNPGNLSGFIGGTNNYQTVNYSKQKAVWFAYLDIDEMLKNADRASFTRSVSNAFDEVVSLGCNTVYVHVRSFGDAYYYSAYYPFTAAYCDVLGSAPDFDPLEIMVSEAHSRGLSFHAWINPMRTTTKERFQQMPEGCALKQWYNSSETNGTFLVYDSESGYYWLSPAYTAVRQLICSGVAEIVSHYNVDAIHIDDYFYPTTSSSFDRAAFEASGRSDRDSWRREVVNTLVKEIYSTVKSCNSNVLFGVSPQGNIENNRDRLYADVETWCSSYGYLDYVVPQIYYGFNDKLPFDTAAKQWEDIVALPNVSLVCGIAAYKVGVNSEWSSGSMLKKQTDHIAQSSVFDGVAYYRYGSLFGTASSSQRLMQSELTALKGSVALF